MEVNKIYTENCLETVRRMPDGFLNCVVTSPPYFGLRDYGTAKWEGGDADCPHRRMTKKSDKTITGHKNFDEMLGVGDAIYKDVCKLCGAKRVDDQFGLEETPEAYVQNLVDLFREIRRVLRDDGTVWLNLGSSYAGSGGAHKENHKNPDLSKSLYRSGVPHEVSCGNFDKELEGYQHHDCLCGNLCGVCQSAYQTRKFRNDNLLSAMLFASLSESTLGSMEFESCRFPTLDFSILENRILTAIQRFGRFPDLVNELPLSFLESMPDEFYRQLLVECWRRGGSSECLLCARSLISDDTQSEHKLACTCGTSLTDHPLDFYNQGKVFSYKAYPNLTNMYQNIKPKDLINIPFYVAEALRADGWYLRQDIVWSKKNCMPESVTDRCTKAHEYIFLLSKSPKYYYDAEAIKEDSLHPTAKASWTSESRISRAIMFHKKPVGNEANGSKYEGFEKRNRRSVWTVTTKPYSEAHFATYPEALIVPCIKAGCPEGGIVYDPFGGAGTTALVSHKLKRNWVLSELNPEYVKIAEKRLRPWLKQTPLMPLF